MFSLSYRFVTCTLPVFLVLRNRHFLVKSNQTQKLEKKKYFTVNQHCKSEHHIAGVSISMCHMTECVIIFENLQFHSPHHNARMTKKLRFCRTKMSQCGRKAETERKRLKCIWISVDAASVTLKAFYRVCNYRFWAVHIRLLEETTQPLV